MTTSTYNDVFKIPKIQELWDVIKQDSYVTGLYKKAGPELAKLVGCQVGDFVGCAIFSAAVHAGLDPKVIYEWAYEGCIKDNPDDPYAKVRNYYELLEDDINMVIRANDKHRDRSYRLSALNLVLHNIDDKNE